MTLADAPQRRAAVDPLRSFCVSAPAGSGKTELLIQRYLVLLSRVVKPEQVLAITFTRKAAGEMRERVMAALADAASGAPVAGAHEQSTRAAAVAALAADAEHGWQLAGNESRLNILTIDSLCGVLTRQMPVLSQIGGAADIVDDATPLYRDAIQGLFGLLESGSGPAPALRELLVHFDNDWQRVQELLMALLQRRDQWGGFMGLRHNPGEAAETLVATVHALVAETLADLSRALAPWSAELSGPLGFTADQLGLAAVEGFPSASPEDLPGWRALHALLLTRDGRWRRQLNKRSGFPAGDEEAGRLREQVLAVIEDVQSRPGLREALSSIEYLPDIGTLDTGWQLTVNLMQVLPRLSAELLLVFARRGQVDHNQVTLAALDALGEDDDPTELALRLDYRIEHILVDEFQDTAINQFELVRRLSRGWHEHNQAYPLSPRTLLIVGDPMQSIYGFRNANVGLFLKARDQGFNGVTLEPLQLQANFRSDAALVDWFNATFEQAFPSRTDIRRGRVSFSPAIATRACSEADAVEIHGFEGQRAAEREIGFICDQVRHGLDLPDRPSIAILGRSRTTLRPLLAEFNHRGIAASTQGLETLAEAPEIIDLVSLCRALQNPADRIAWLAVLRAPWCGMTLADLHALAGRPGSLPRLIDDPASAARLSVDGQQRLAVVRSAVALARHTRDRLGLRNWLEQVWRALGGAETLTATGADDAVERFFQLVEHVDRRFAALNLDWLVTELEKLAVDRVIPDARVEVMTLHKAKGLEFDWVFIPALERTVRRGSRPLLLWDEVTTRAGERGFLLAADDHSAAKSATLYNFLDRQRAEKARLETARLMYVGATRAARRLFLSARIQREQKSGEWRAPPGDALLSPVWTAFAARMAVHSDPPGRSASGPPVVPGLTRVARLPNRRAEPPAGAASALVSPRTDHRDRRLQRQVGIVVHRTLQYLSQLAELPGQLPAVTAEACDAALRQAGLAGGDLLRARQRVATAVQQTLASRDGRWLLSSSRHRQSLSEWPVTHIGADGVCRQLVIDRSFVTRDTGERWLVDYKTDSPVAGEDRAAFTRSAIAAHSPQLLRYRDAVAAMTDEPLRCALYLTELGALVELEDLRGPAGQ